MTVQQPVSSRDQVIARIADPVGALKPFEDLLLQDWGYGEEHFLWAAVSPLEEVLEWCRLVRGGVPVDCLGSAKAGQSSPVLIPTLSA